MIDIFHTFASRGLPFPWPRGRASRAVGARPPGRAAVGGGVVSYPVAGSTRRHQIPPDSYTPREDWQGDSGRQHVKATLPPRGEAQFLEGGTRDHPPVDCARKVRRTCPDEGLSDEA